MDISIDHQGLLSTQQALSALTLTSSRRRWILKDLGRWERRATKSRLKRQKDVNNAKFKPRRNGSKQESLKGFSDGMEPYVKHNNTYLDLSWQNKLKAKKAAVHNFGFTEKMTAEKARKQRGQPDYDAECTKDQAIALRRLGYRIRRKDGKGWNKPSIRNIRKRLTLGQAGLIIRMLRTGEPKGKSSWDVKYEERRFFGSKKEKVRERTIKNIEKARTKK
ncbi:hypothetical protein AABD45_02890 [Vibrio vulnificus]|uniref:hypothetical protein n=1 Tax=Vibrio vulnificus TaxID=672 RepID=UPI00324A267C